MDSLLRERRSNVPGGPLTALQVMSPNGPSTLTAPGPQEVGGEHVEGRQDLIPALQASGTVNGISPPGREGLVLQASEGNQGLAPSGLAQAPPKGAGLDLVPTRVGGESSPNRTHPFTTALSQYGSTEPFRPVQMEVSTSTTVVEQAQAGLRQGFRWLGEIVHRTIGVGPGEYQIDPLLVPSPLPSRTSPPGHAQSIGSVVGPTTPNQRSLMPPSSWSERPPEGTPPLFSQEQLHQLRRLQQASPLLQGPLQAQEKQTSSSNTTNIQEEVRRQVSDFMSQQAQAMHRLQSENEALRERLQVRQSPPHERPQLVDQPPHWE